jgi:hypothetical protein
MPAISVKKPKQKKTPVVWLIRPWIEDFSAFDHFDQPVEFLVIAAWLRHHGCSIHYIDGLRGKTPQNIGENRGDKPENALKLDKYSSLPIKKPIIFSKIPRYYKRFGIPVDTFKSHLEHLPEPQVILVTTGMTYWYQAVQGVWTVLNELSPDVPKAVGGVYAGIVPEHARQHLHGATVFPGGAGNSFYRWMSQAVGYTIPTPDINDWILPAWDLVPERTYVTFVTSRGCRRHCSYCAASLLASTWQARSLIAVRNEIERLISQFTIRDIALYDDDLGCSTPEGKKHFRDFLNMLAENTFPVRWHLPNAVSVDAVTPDTAKLMAAAGFEQPRLSLPHMDRHLDNNGLDKHACLAFHNASTNLLEAGYRTEYMSTYLITGLPGQKLRGLQHAAEQLQKIGIRPYLAQFSPIPGTRAGDIRLRQLVENFQVKDLLLTNKILSVYAHEGWTGHQYQSFAAHLKNG